MIIVKIIGGLGNQLFQYSLGRNLAEKYDTNLKLDISEFGTYKLHKYSLNAYNIIEDFATSEEIKSLAVEEYASVVKYIRKKLGKSLWKKAKSYKEEQRFYFDQQVLNFGNNVYLEGYWQCERYFKDIEDIIRKELTLKVPLEDRNKEVLSLIRKVNSVSLHIRRGDYVSNPETNSVLGACSLEYYRHCIEHIASNVENPHFFLFSDDINWTREKLEINHPATVVDGNSADANYVDLYLMSNCKHNIIANSSFSWWGAWLNNNANKIIIAPTTWFVNSPLTPKDIIPENWLKL